MLSECIKFPSTGSLPTSIAAPTPVRRKNKGQVKRSGPTCPTPQQAIRASHLRAESDDRQEPQSASPTCSCQLYDCFKHWSVCTPDIPIERVATNTSSPRHRCNPLRSNRIHQYGNEGVRTFVQRSSQALSNISRLAQRGRLSGHNRSLRDCEIIVHRISVSVYGPESAGESCVAGR